MNGNEFNNAFGDMSPLAIIIWLAVGIFLLIADWKLYEKAGKPGWAVLIPIYNVIVLLQIVNRPIWWIVLYLIPIVNIVVAIILIFDLAKAYNQSVGFGFGLLFLPIIFIPILGFGSAEYVGVER